MNLCNSGYARCYTHGSAIEEAAGVIASLRPDIVTLNEICRGDVEDQLRPALAETWPLDWTFYAFMPALETTTGQPILCMHGGEYGVAVIGHVSDDRHAGIHAFGENYSIQDTSTEQRAWTCVHAQGEYFACTTHLSAASETVALAQCNHMLSTVIPTLRSDESVDRPTFIGGDFNLHYDASDPQNVQLCVPRGYTRKDDGDVQHIMSWNSARFLSATSHAMTYTDHDALLGIMRLDDPDRL